MDLHISLAGRTDLSGEIYRQIRAAILHGRLRPGQRLPASRELARYLGVARMTVTVAYERLAAEGYVTARVGAGTFVSENLAGAARRHRRRREAGELLSPRPVWRAVPEVTWFLRAAEFDFRSGVPDTSLFPVDAWRRLLARQWRTLAGAGYGEPAGHTGLRDAVAQHLGVARGINTSAAEVVITNGTQQGLDVVARVLLKPGARVAVEDPGYGPAYWLLHCLGLRVQTVPVDREGLVVQDLHPSTRLVYVTPSHQYPLGVSMSLRRRQELLGWAQRHRAAVIEDDYDSEFRFYSRPIEPLKTLDTGHVIYLGSFSKTILPALRLGYVVAPSTLTPALSRARFVNDWHSPIPTQAALASFIDSGAFAGHLHRMRAVYQQRHELVTAILGQDFVEDLELMPSAAGLHVAALARGTFLHHVDGIADSATTLGVAVQELSWFSHNVKRPRGLVLGYGAIANSRITEGLRRLRTCLDIAKQKAP